MHIHMSYEYIIKLANKPSIQPVRSNSLQKKTKGGKCLAVSS